MSASPNTRVEATSAAAPEVVAGANAAAREAAAKDGATDVALYRHAKRKRWGVAALLWERDGKRGYQFSDGKLRVFKQGYYHLFESAAPPGDGSAKTVRRLARLARADDVTEAARLPTLRDQMLLIRRSFPEGLASEKWQRKYRGLGARKRLKRHRDPAVSEADQLSVAQLDRLIEGFAWAEIHDRLHRVLAATNLIPAAQLKKLVKIHPSRELALGLRDWVAAATGELDEGSLKAPAHASEEARESDRGQGQGDLLGAERERRFNHLVRLLGPAGTWPIMTAIAGLLAPDQHTCVRPSVYEVQAKMLLPNFQVSKKPRYASYVQQLHVAKTVFDELEAAGLAPHDLLDVYDFIWETLRPAARDELTRQYELPPPPALDTEASEASEQEAA